MDYPAVSKNGRVILLNRASIDTPTSHRRRRNPSSAAGYIPPARLTGWLEHWCGDSRLYTTRCQAGPSVLTSSEIASSDGTTRTQPLTPAQRMEICEELE